MTDDHVIIEKLADGIRSRFALGTTDSLAEIEAFLGKELGRFALQERLHLLELLRQRFDSDDSSPDRTDTGGGRSVAAPNEVTQLVSLFLGKNISPSELSSREIAGKFAESLKTLFDTLNEIVSVINVTLLGQHPELETIRKVIGSNMEERPGREALKEYLNQIRQAFQIAHASFQKAAAALFEEMLSELDPEVMNQTKTSGLKFGPLRKAELYDVYEERHARCKRWFTSGQFTEQLLRNFEKNCQQTYKFPMR